MESQMKLLKKSEHYKLTVTASLEEKIRFLCKELPRNEYSGTLFYRVEGSFETNDLHIVCVDFYLQDVGESTFTEFSNDVSLAGYMVEHELLDCCQGLMHSHNAMPTFFSGTDTGTLLSEGKDTNHFVSLIVNNAGTYRAAITRKVHTEEQVSSSSSYHSFNDVEKKSDVVKEKRVFDYIEYFVLDVTKEHYVQEKSELEIRLEEVRKSSSSYINRPKGVGLNIPADVQMESPHESSIWLSKVSDKEPEKPGQGTQTIIDFDEVKEIVDESLKGQHGHKSSVESEVHLFSDKKIQDDVARLLTGNMFISFNTKFDINVWVKSMEYFYDKLFNVNSDSDFHNSNFGLYAETMVEALAMMLEPEWMPDDGEDEVSAVWACQMSDVLCTLPQNKYIAYYQEIITRWM